MCVNACTYATLCIFSSTGYFMRGGKQFSPILFIVCVVVLIFVGALSCRKAEKVSKGTLCMSKIFLQFCEGLY